MDAKPYPFTPDQEAWLRDLETTEQPQTTGYLNLLEQVSKVGGGVHPAGFCCLGRACEVLGLEKEVKEDDPVAGYRASDCPGSMWGALPREAKERLRLRSLHGELEEPHEGFEALSGMNDAGWSFKQIAQYIRANPENVFLPLEGEI